MKALEPKLKLPNFFVENLDRNIQDLIRLWQLRVDQSLELFAFESAYPCPKFDLMPKAILSADFYGQNSPRTSLQPSHLLKNLAQNSCSKLAWNGSSLKKVRMTRVDVSHPEKLGQENQHEKRGKENRLLGESRGGKDFFWNLWNWGNFPFLHQTCAKTTEDLSEQTSFDPLSLCLDS